MTADWQTVSNRLYTPERVESRQRRLCAPTGKSQVFMVLPFYCSSVTGENGTSYSSDAVREAISNEGKKLPVVMSALVFCQTFTLAGEQNIQFDRESFFSLPPLPGIQKYMCIDVDGTFGRGKKKNKAFPEWQSDSHYNY